MKVDRRSFLGLGIGAVAGIAVSPVGAKLTDDFSIWTQNWPWTPVPPDGEISFDRSICHLCPGACGISVRKIDNRPVKIEGLEQYPVNDGGICMHGIAGLQYLYDPSRVKTPLKKINDRFVPVSWEEALTMVAENLGALRTDNKTEALACIIDSDQGSVAGLFKHFMTAFGSANLLTMPDLESWLVRTAATLHGPGHTLGFDTGHSDFILSFGAGLIDGWGSPVACIQAMAGRKQREATLVQIEPRLSNTAAGADRWIPINPGTEADLAMGMCAVLLKENLFDPGFAQGFEGGFMRFTAMVQKEYPLDKVAAVTGIDAADIQKTAIAFTKAKMPVALPGKGRGEGAQSLKEFAAVHTLNCLSGNINKKGGTFVKPLPDYLTFPDPVQDDTAQNGAAAEPLAASVQELVARIHESSDSPVKALIVYNANPCFALNNPSQVRAAFEKIPFKVCVSSFMDETAMASDVILPVSTFLERMEDIPTKAGLAATVVGLSRPMVTPVFDTRSPGDVVIAMAKALNGTVAQSFVWNDYENCLKQVAADIWGPLSKKGHVVLMDRPPAETVATDFSFLAENPDTVKPEGDQEFTLIPIDNIRVPTTVPAASPFAIKTVSDRVIKGRDMFVEINPQSAGSLKDGGFATLTTPAGSFRVRVHFNDGIMPGVIGMVKGLGHTLNNRYVSGKGVNINELMSPKIEPGSGMDAAYGIKAGISKA
jgi:anaerobic selenocysteine-containing dehydrogenase